MHRRRARARRRERELPVYTYQKPRRRKRKNLIVRRTVFVLLAILVISLAATVVFLAGRMAIRGIGSLFASRAPRYQGAKLVTNGQEITAKGAFSWNEVLLVAPSPGTLEVLKQPGDGVSRDETVARIADDELAAEINAEIQQIQSATPVEGADPTPVLQELGTALSRYSAAINADPRAAKEAFAAANEAASKLGDYEGQITDDASRQARLDELNAQLAAASTSVTSAGAGLYSNQLDGLEGKPPEEVLSQGMKGQISEVETGKSVQAGELIGKVVPRDGTKLYVLMSGAQADKLAGWETVDVAASGLAEELANAKVEQVIDVGAQKCAVILWDGRLFSPSRLVDVTLSAPDQSQPLVDIPSSALVQSDGGTVVYVEGNSTPLAVSVVKAGRKTSTVTGVMPETRVVVNPSVFSK